MKLVYRLVFVFLAASFYFYYAWDVCFLLNFLNLSSIFNYYTLVYMVSTEFSLLFLFCESHFSNGDDRLEIIFSVHIIISLFKRIKLLIKIASKNMLGNPMPTKVRRKLQGNMEEVEEALFYNVVVLQYCITNLRSVSHIMVTNYP